MMEAMSSTQFNEWMAYWSIVRQEEDAAHLESHAKQAVTSRQRLR